jgi:hypothetical protein
MTRREQWNDVRLLQRWAVDPRSNRSALIPAATSGEPDDDRLPPDSRENTPTFRRAHAERISRA